MTSDRHSGSGFFEEVVAGFRYAYDAEILVSERSPYQLIEVYEHPAFGRVLVLDGLVQTTERDEFLYHEMLAHVPLLCLEEPRRVLIIGGGDGGTLRHVLMHPSVERAVMVEIDERVTTICRKLMPSLAGDAFDDARAHVIFADGIAFVRESDEAFDAILIDSSDPVGPGEGLFTADFYRAAAGRLTEGGVLAAQSGSPLFQQDEMHRMHANARAAFDDVRPYLGAVPTYPGGLWSFVLCGERLEVDAAAAAARAAVRRLSPRWWSPALHEGAFGLPALVAAVVAPEGPPVPWGHSPEERDRRAVP